MENWKPVVGYEGLYEVSDMGRVRRVTNKGFRSLWGSDDKDMYRQISLCRNNVPVKRKVHRLVAESFLGDIAGMEINHKDGNPRNNNLSNLEIVTRSQNALHAYRVLGRSNGAEKLGKAVCVFSIKPRKSQKSEAIADKLVGVFESRSSAAKFLGVGAGQISASIRSKHLTCNKHLVRDNYKQTA